MNKQLAMKNSFKKSLLTLVSLVCCLSLVLPVPVAFAQEAMSSGTYIIQSDSINFAGALSQSASYTLEDTLGEIATGNVASANFAGEIGYQAMLILVNGDTTAPSAPSFISANPLTSSRIEVTWGESTDNVAVTRYYVYRDGTRVADTAIFPRSFTDIGLDADTLYSYNVSAVDDAGNESIWSATTSARTLASPTPTQSGSVVPILHNVSIIPTETLALVTFDTTVAVQTKISWGTDTNYSLGNLSNDNFLGIHSFIIPNLIAGNIYYLKIELTRQDGFVFTYDNIAFSTLSLPNVLTPPNVTNFRADANEENVSLSWNLPTDPSVVSVRLVRRENFFPSSPTEGEIIFDGLATNFLDTNVMKGVKYYYTAFARDLSGNFSSGVAVSAYILKPGEVTEPDIPFENIEKAGDVHPLIEALVISDFLFIQDGQILEVLPGDKIKVNGNKNLAIALRAYRVPPVLKTIAITLATQEDVPKYFTFILRINKDGTRYEAVIAPLGETNTYDLKITIVDFNNKGLKKLEGTVFVSSMAIWDVLNPQDRKSFIYSLIFLLLIILIAIFISRHGKKSNQNYA